jgi:hypothetical protein
VLSRGLPPSAYTPLKSGYGAGTRDPKGRANALRIILAEGDAAEGREELVVLACDLDDLSGEYVAGAADALRDAGALDVTLVATLMKKGRPGQRLEVLCTPADADRLERLLLLESTSIGVRRTNVTRRILARDVLTVDVGGHAVRLKRVVLPDGSTRVKPEWDDVQRAAGALGVPAVDVADRARRAADTFAG